jgi:hypothetical protein
LPPMVIAIADENAIASGGAAPADQVFVDTL